MNNIITPKSSTRAIPTIVFGAFLGCLLPAIHAGTPALPPPTIEAAANWKDHTVTPVSDPILFEDPVIRTEIRPVMGYQRIGHDTVLGGGDLEVYGVQIRYALTDRLQIVMDKGGYDDVHPKLGPDFAGWANLAGGLKYAVIDDMANQFILTPGITFEVPTGEDQIFQGKGSGVWNFFVSAEKGWGDFHLTGNAGFLIPNDNNADSSEFHWHVQADYYCCRWFKPFIVANGYTVLNAGNHVPFTSEGMDLVNLGSSGADGVTQVTVGGGFRSGITKNVDFGFAYEKGVANVKGILDDRFTFDFSIHF